MNQLTTAKRAQVVAALPVAKEGTGAGSVWTWVGIEADSKLAISYLCGKRDAEWGEYIHGGFGIACDHAHSDHDGRTQGLR